MVTHESTRTFTPRQLNALVDLFSRNVIRQSLVRTNYPWRSKRLSRTLPPTFLFLQYSIVKEQTPQTQCRDPLRFWLRGRPSVAHAALLNFAEGRSRSELLYRQRRTALVRGAYIVGACAARQHRFRTFLNFLRRIFRTVFSIADCPCGSPGSSTTRPYCRRIEA